MAVALGVLLAKGRTIRRWPPLAIIALLSGALGVYLQSFPLLLISTFAGAGLIAPMFIGGYTLGLMRQGKLIAAADWADRLRWFNADWGHLAQQWRLVVAHHRGAEATVNSQLDRWTSLGDPRSLASRDGVYMLLGQWNRLQYSSIVEYRVRALAELGELEQAVLAFAGHWHIRRGLRGQRVLRRAGLAILAFAGRVEVVESLLTLLNPSLGVRDYWLYTALVAADRQEQAWPLKERRSVVASDNPILRDRWRQRDIAFPVPEGLDPSSEDVLREASAEILSAYRLRLSWFWREPVVTLFLSLACCGFALQAFHGGVDDPLVAVSLGALTAEGILPMESWRLISYGFLHFGWLHLLTNLSVLAITGPIIVRTHGTAYFISIFLGGVLSAGVSISLFGMPGITVGASGGTMALVGALTAYVLTEATIRRTRWGRLMSLFLCSLVLLELATDVLSPSISLAGHLGGLGLGLLLGLIAPFPRQETQHAP
jgi:membrane associated rhomboid family serine protease